MSRKMLEKVCFGGLALYVVAAVLFCILAQNQIHYTADRKVYAAESSQGNLGEVFDGTVVEQDILSKGEYVSQVQVMLGTFGRVNNGELKMELFCGEALLADQVLPYSSITDNTWSVWNLGGYLETTGEMLTLRLSFLGGEKGNSITGNYQLNTGDSMLPLRMNGEQVPDRTLCVMLVQQGDSVFALYYIPLFAAGFILLLLGVLRILRCQKTGRDNFILSRINALARYRFLLEQLVSRDFKTKYKRSFLGVLWSLLNPLLMMGVQYVVFSQIFRFQVENYPVYLLSGVVVFNAFSEATTQSMYAIVGNASLITKVYVPKYIYPVSKVFSSVINLMFSLAALLLVALITGVQLKPQLLLMPFGIVCLVGFCVGLSFALSAALVFFRDLQFLWSIATMMWMYATPIIYPISTIENIFLYDLQIINPLYHFISFFRTILLEGISPRPIEYLWCLGFAMLSIAVGSWIFKKTQNRFVLYL